MHHLYFSLCLSLILTWERERCLDALAHPPGCDMQMLLSVDESETERLKLRSECFHKWLMKYFQAQQCKSVSSQRSELNLPAGRNRKTIISLWVKPHHVIYSRDEPQRTKEISIVFSGRLISLILLLWLWDLGNTRSQFQYSSPCWCQGHVRTSHCLQSLIVFWCVMRTG